MPNAPAAGVSQDEGGWYLSLAVAEDPTRGGQSAGPASPPSRGSGASQTGGGSTCENCGRQATDVHHLNYDNLYCERDTDLIALCRDCHAWRHQVAANDNEHQLEFLFQPPKKEGAL